jgi:hypothetical protein
MSEGTQRVINEPNAALKPYLERSLMAAERERNRPYTPYRAPRVEGLTRDQLAAMRGIRSIQMPGAFRDAQRLYGKSANLAGREAKFKNGKIDARYDPRAVKMFKRPGKSKMFKHPGTSKMFSRPGDAKMFSRPGDSKMFSRPGDAKMFARPGDIGVFDRPDDLGHHTWYDDFSSSNVQKYMNPFVEGVLNISKREAERDHQKQAAAQRLTAAKQGAFGGSRAAIVERDMRRDHDQRMDDLHLKGMAAAFDNAAGMFDRDRTSRAAQAGMLTDVDKYNAALAMQHGMAGMDADKFNVGTRMQHGQMGLANQHFNIGKDLQHGQMRLQNQQFNIGKDMDYGKVGLMNQHFNIGKNMDYGRLGLQNQQFNIGTNMDYGKTGLQNQQFNIGVGMDYGRLGLQNAQFNEGQRMQSSDMRLRRQIAQEQARLGAAGHRLGAIQAMNPMAQGLAEIGRNQFGMQMDKYNALNQMGEQQRGINQSALDNAYQEYLRQQNWGRDSLAWQQGIMSGMPLPGSAFSYGTGPIQQAPSMASTLAGGLTGMMGAWSRG